MNMIVLLKFKVDMDQLKDKTDETVVKMHILLQEYCKNALDTAIQEDGGTQFKLIESACAKMFPDENVVQRHPKAIDGLPKMTGGE